MLDKNDKIVCDFCGKESGVEQMDPKTALYDWNGGQRGKTWSLAPVSGYSNDEIKHSCPDKLCQAKLLVWART